MWSWANQPKIHLLYELKVKITIGIILGDSKIMLINGLANLLIYSVNIY